MNVVVIGGSGLIGRKVVSILSGLGHQVKAASLSSGVNILTGDGLDQAMAGGQILIDVSNSPNFEDRAVLDFFQTSTGNLLKAARKAGIEHFVALSVVGADRLPESGYMRAKLAQEALVRASSIPFTIVRATQFFEFVEGIAQAATEGTTVRVPAALMQPIQSDDVAEILSDFAISEPVNRIVEIAGPEPIPMDTLIQTFLTAKRDTRQVKRDSTARYYGTALNDQSLTPGQGPRLGSSRFGDWLQSSHS